MPFVRGNRMRGLIIAAAALSAVGLSACSSMNPFDGNDSAKVRTSGDNAAAIGVNGYLWRATLDTLSFMPLQSADPYGGVIVTDWYTNPNSPNERVKLTVSILDQDLRADALRVAASREVNQNGVWVNAPVAAATVQKLEDIILTRARDLRRTTVGG